MSIFEKYPQNVHFLEISTKCQLLGNFHICEFFSETVTYFFLFDNFYGDWFFIGSFYSGKDLSKSATSNKIFFLIKTKIWSIFICVRERASVNFFQILKKKWISGLMGQFCDGSPIMGLLKSTKVKFDRPRLSLIDSS